ncbi:AAA family ATPase [Solicola gregarius]|uniref:ATP-binding protein n=1 Tax=Solicola gregarius TaxID=2908642 RepID=A0AA46YKF4_9ACTN|nr:ATP-binding protein [Solicola gregarius]UYM04514.1 ATP-binding protein [Solicola gregarius]
MTDTNDFIATYKRFLDQVVRDFDGREPRVSPLTERISDHLGHDARELPVVKESLSRPRLVDADLAIAAIAADGHDVIGLAGPPDLPEASFATILRGGIGRLDLGAVDYVSLPTGPDAERQVVARGIHLFTYDGARVAILQRDAAREWGADTATLEVVAADREVVTRLLQDVRRRMIERSVLRGQLMTFTGDEYEATLGGITFHRRPDIAAADVILPDGTLERLARHVVQLGDHRDRMLAAGQHLKRGILLYGPPGTGKTHTVRHLLTRTDGTTAIMLAGGSLALIGEATRIARAMQPAIIVLEDCDLIAQDRDLDDGPETTLFEVLEALDGLDGDADVTFLLTTNRVDLLERALAQRPGRVDLAVEIPLPDERARRELFALYAEGLAFSAEALGAAAERAEDVTASFAKELIRRAVLDAAIVDAEPCDVHLSDALDELLSDRESLTRSLLASGPKQFAGDGDDDDDGWGDADGEARGPRDGYSSALSIDELDV